MLQFSKSCWCQWSKVKGAFFKGKCSNQCECYIFQPGFGCCTLQTLVKIVIFSIFSAKKLLKSKKFAANFCKKHVFFSLRQNADRQFYSPKEEKAHFFGNKAFWCQLKKTYFLQKFAANFLLFWLFTFKNAENDYFNQRFGVHSTQTLVDIYNK